MSVLAVKAPDSMGGKSKIVVVVGTGGTIAQAGSREATVPIDALVHSATDHESDVVVRSEQAFQIPSPDITPVHWAALTKHVRMALEKSDVVGVVVTHGTDTLEETAYFLDLVLSGAKPVVVVGSMRPSDSSEADGPSNLRDAIALACATEARNRGVLVTLDGRVEGARDVTKTHTKSLNAFRSPNVGSLGLIDGGTVRFAKPAPENAPAGPFSSYEGETLPTVEIVYGYAGVGASGFDAIRAAGARGVVIAGTGDGSVPRALLSAVADLRKSGVVVVRSSRTNGGSVRRNGEVDDDALDLVASHTLNPQKARVLLMLSLWAGHGVEAIQRSFASASTST